MPQITSGVFPPIKTPHFAGVDAFLASYRIPVAGLFMRVATKERDLAQVEELINSAFAEEMGSTGRAFKKTKRFVNGDAKEHFNQHGITILLEGKTPKADGSRDVRAVVYLEVKGSRCFLGPLAVHPAYQGNNYGVFFFKIGEEVAALEPGVTHLCGYVVNIRQDLVKFYQRRGAYVVGKAPFYAAHAHRLTRPSKDLWFVVMEKDLTSLKARM